MNPVLSLLGLALRGGRLAVGDEPAALAARAGEARLLLSAQDAGGSMLRRAEHLAETGHCVWLTVPFSKAELGGALGRGTAAIVAVTDLGLAAAVVKRLAALDPEAYGSASERMALKVRRAEERKKAPRRKPPEKQKTARPPEAQRGRWEHPPAEDGKRFPGNRGGRPPEAREERPSENRHGSAKERGKRPPGMRGAYWGTPRKPEGHPEKRPRPNGQHPFHGSGPRGRSKGRGRGNGPQTGGGR